jgi:hypothetical protein
MGNMMMMMMMMMMMIHSVVSYQSRSSHSSWPSTPREAVVTKNEAAPFVRPRDIHAAAAGDRQHPRTMQAAAALRQAVLATSCRACYCFNTATVQTAAARLDLLAIMMCPTTV